MELPPQVEIFHQFQVLEIIQALQGAKELIDSLEPALLIAAIHGESGTPELRKLNELRMDKIEKALVLLKGE